MFTEIDEVKRFDYNELCVSIFKHPCDDGEGGYYDTFCFVIHDYDDNNIMDNCLFDSEDNNIFADTIDDAEDNAIAYIDKHF